MNKKIFEGNVEVYLHGIPGLQSVDENPDKDGRYAQYYIGGNKNFILNVKTTRLFSTLEEFNVPSHITIYETPDSCIIVDYADVKDEVLECTLILGSIRAPLTNDYLLYSAVENGDISEESPRAFISLYQCGLADDEG